jgi:formate dehydrogenase major subunit
MRTTTARSGREAASSAQRTAGFADLPDAHRGQFVDVHGVYEDNVERVMRKLRVVSYPTASGCAATCYPEANVLVPLESVAEGSNMPALKAVIVRLEPSAGTV